MKKLVFALIICMAGIVASCNKLAPMTEKADTDNVQVDTIEAVDFPADSIVPDSILIC